MKQSTISIPKILMHYLNTNTNTNKTTTTTTWWRKSNKYDSCIERCFNSFNINLNKVDCRNLSILDIFPAIVFMVKIINHFRVIIFHFCLFRVQDEKIKIICFRRVFKFCIEHVQLENIANNFAVVETNR